MFIDAVCSPLVLALRYLDLPCTVDTDDSEKGLGCTLFRTYEDGERKPIRYWSRSLKPAEKNYSAPEREFLGLVWALLTLCHHLQFRKCVAHTDHLERKWLLNITEHSSRLQWWRLRLAQFYLKSVTKTGRTPTMQIPKHGSSQSPQPLKITKTKFHCSSSRSQNMTLTYQSSTSPQSLTLLRTTTRRFTSFYPWKKRQIHFSKRSPLRSYSLLSRTRPFAPNSAAV